MFPSLLIPDNLNFLTGNFGDLEKKYFEGVFQNCTNVQIRSGRLLEFNNFYSNTGPRTAPENKPFSINDEYKLSKF